MQSERWAHQYQTVFTVFMGVLAVLFRDSDNMVYPEILYLMLALLLLNFVSGLALKHWPFQQWIAAFIISANSAVITEMLRFSGGPESKLWVLYLLPIFTASLLLGGKEAAWVTLGCISFNAMYYIVSLPAWAPVLYFEVILKCGIFIFAWALISKLADKHRISESELSVRSQDLKEVEAKMLLFRKLIERLNDAILIIDPVSQLFLDCNETACRMLGYTKDELMNLYAHEIDANHQIQEEWAQICKQWEERREISIETDAKRKDGTSFPVEIKIRLVFHEGKDYGVSILRDLTAQKKTEEAMRLGQEQLQHSQKMEAVGRLAGGVAHDFNNILTAIIGLSQLQVETVEEGSTIRSDFEEIIRLGERAAALTRQMLAFSRKQASKTSILNLDRSIEESIKMLRRLLPESIELKMELNSGKDCIKADAGQIEQVIMNLAVNSRDAMPQGGVLSMATKPLDLREAFTTRHEVIPPNSYIVLSIKDTGTGMDENTLAHLFEPFFTTKKQGLGTGLGSSIVYGIVKQSSGFITIQSAPGQGSEFQIYFPRVDASQEPVRPSPQAAQPLKGTGTILVVEDEDAVRHLATRILTQQGYTVLEARNGQDALDLWYQHQEKIKLTISDIVMPKMGGLELGKRLFASNQDARILYISGYTTESGLQEHLADLKAQFLEKPFSPESLAKKVQEIISPITSSYSVTRRFEPCPNKN